MRRVCISIFVFVLLVTAGFYPSLAAAAPLESPDTVLTLPIDTSNFLAQGLVTCNGPDCTFCSLMAMVNNIIAWLVGIAMVIATIGLAIAGYKMVYSQGNASAVTYAKSIFFNIIIGIILIIGAWFMIDTLMKLTVGDNFGPWDRIDEKYCGEMFAAPTTLERDIELTDHEIEEFLFEEGVNESDQSVDYSTLPGYYGNSGGIPTIAQVDGYITYGNGAKLTAYQLDTATSPYNYNACPGSTVPPQFFNYAESGNIVISQYYSVCDLTNCNTSQRVGDYGYLYPQAVLGMDLITTYMGGTKLEINSGYRSPTYNAAQEGSATCSQHMAGRAFDIAVQNGRTPVQIEQICRDIGKATWTKVYDTFTHCDWR